MQSSDESRDRDLAALVPLVYEELRNVAERYFRRQPPGFTLRPTEIVHEACLHLIEHSRIDWTSTQHFRAIATKKVWQIVIDHLKRRHAQKRGGGIGALAGGDPAPQAGPDSTHGEVNRAWRRVPFEAISVEWRDRTVDLLDLADALADLSRESRRLNDVVTLHWFGGLTYRDVANYLNISPSTAEKDFRYALAWLNRRLEGTRSDVD